ncbi:hypothetical protein G9A89_013113 [Geosiphon pyriformis]|nr:hypothetical protein G9A89_013113 [Geosiphon pyriformis]
MAAISELDYLAVDCKMLPPFYSKIFSNSAGGPKIFKLFFAGIKSYAKAAAYVVPLILVPSKSVMSLLFVVSFGSDVAVNAKLASLEFHLGELSLLIKSLVEPVGMLVVLVTKLLSALPAVNVFVKESVAGLKKMIHLEKKCEQVCLEDVSNNNNIDDDDNNNDNNDNIKDFSVYDNTFDLMINLWKDQLFSIKFNPDQTASG